MIHVKLISPQKEERELILQKACTIESLLKEIACEHTVVLAKLDNAYRALTHIVYHDCTIELLDISNNAAWLTYQSSLCLLYIKAVHDILGKDRLVTINNSLNKGLYTLIHPKASRAEIARIEERMKELSELDVPIKKVYMTKKEALDLCTASKMKETRKLVETLDENIRDIEIYSLDDELGIYYNLMVPSTSYLKLFELVEYKNGVLLRYPHPTSIDSVPEYKDEPLLYNAFREANRWSSLMGINFINDLNETVRKGEYRDIILLQEALHEGNIAAIAKTIHALNKKIVLICGPSSSGKTTFANRLSIQLKANGLKTLYLGTDDYFKNLDEREILPSGEPDLESIKAVDTKLLKDNLESLMNGEETDLPVFEFKKNRKIFGTRVTKLDRNQIIVLEGIHALNPAVTEGMNKDDIYKIYISPLTPLGIDHHNRIPTTDARLLRRLVRDCKFRGRSPEQVLREWVNVREGEDVNIFPFNNEADCFFNSNCLYELSLLKKYAQDLLMQIKRDKKEYAEAQRLLRFLKYVVTLEDESYILGNSIIREFTGGSIILK
ncbi:MAG: nucleoside kinase [Solobacterium sp.]|nr:nucleoside kinase [Solobacterium sp.]